MLQRRNGACERQRGDEHSMDKRLLHRKDAALAEEWIGSATAVGSTVGHHHEAVAATTRFDAFERVLDLQRVNAARGTFRDVRPSILEM